MPRAVRAGHRTIHRVAATALIGVVGVAVLGGCDTTENADLDRGRQLFISQCGTCHALSEAGTSAQIGPDLDAAFADARASGMDSDTIEGVVQSQIANPREIDENEPDRERTYMPPDIVTGRDSEDVSAYVASVAGVPGAKPPELPPEQLFTERCGSCHALSAAGTTGTVGPDLDQALRGQSEPQVRKQIVDPNSQITPGYPPNVMPDDFEQSLTPQELQGLVRYLIQQTQG